MKRSNFPLLQPDFNNNEKRLRRLWRQDPLSWAEVQRWKQYAARILAAPGERMQTAMLAQDLRNVLGGDASDEVIANQFQGALENAHQFLQTLIQDWIPEGLRPPLSAEGKVSAARNPIALFSLWQDFYHHQNGLAKVREFELRRLWNIALLIYELQLSRVRYPGEGAMQRITGYLENAFFSTAPLKDVTVVSYHQPREQMLVKTWRYADESPEGAGEGLTAKETNFTCRSFRWDGRDYFVDFYPREKKIFDHLLKMLRKNIRDPYAAALDLMGLRFVFFSLDALDAGLDKLRSCAFYLPGVSWKMTDNLLGAVDRKNNKHSSAAFFARKYIFLIQGIACEILIEMVTNYLNAHRSEGAQNHYLYRVRQLSQGVFPLLFPTCLYGINWRKKETREAVFDFVKARIK